MPWTMDLRHSAVWEDAGRSPCDQCERPCLPESENKPLPRVDAPSLRTLKHSGFSLCLFPPPEKKTWRSGDVGSWLLFLPHLINEAGALRQPEASSSLKTPPSSLWGGLNDTCASSRHPLGPPEVSTQVLCTFILFLFAPRLLPP